MKKIINITDKDMKNFKIYFNAAKNTTNQVNILLDWENKEIWFNSCKCDGECDISHQVIYLDNYNENDTPEEILGLFVDNFNWFANEFSGSPIEYELEI